MPTRVQAFPHDLPLIATSDDGELLKVMDERERLGRRIAELRPRSFKRIELQVRMRELTKRQLELETRTGKAGA